MKVNARALQLDELPRLAPALEADPFGGLASPLECLQRCALLELEDDQGAPFALVAVEPRQLSGGLELQLVAGVRVNGSGPWMPAALGQLEAWAGSHGVDVLTFVTGKPGVARLAQRAGWKQSGAVFARRVRKVQ